MLAQADTLASAESEFAPGVGAAQADEHARAVENIRAMFAARVRQPGDVDLAEIMRVTGMASHHGATAMMRRLVHDKLYTEHVGVYDPATGRSKTVWRKVDG